MRCLQTQSDGTPGTREVMHAFMTFAVGVVPPGFAYAPTPPVVYTEPVQFSVAKKKTTGPGTPGQLSQ